MKPIYTSLEEGFWPNFKTYIQKLVVKKEENNQTTQKSECEGFAIKIS